MAALFRNDNHNQVSGVVLQKVHNEVCSVTALCADSRHVGIVRAENGREPVSRSLIIPELPLVCRSVKGKQRRAEDERAESLWFHPEPPLTCSDPIRHIPGKSREGCQRLLQASPDSGRRRRKGWRGRRNLMALYFIKDRFFTAMPHSASFMHSACCEGGCCCLLQAPGRHREGASPWHGEKRPPFTELMRHV